MSIQRPLKFGVAYHGNRFLSHAAEDLRTVFIFRISIFPNIAHCSIVLSQIHSSFSFIISSPCFETAR